MRFCSAPRLALLLLAGLPLDLGRVPEHTLRSLLRGLRDLLVEQGLLRCLLLCALLRGLLVQRGRQRRLTLCPQRLRLRLGIFIS